MQCSIKIVLFVIYIDNPIFWIISVCEIIYIKMILFGILCLIAKAVALPVIPEAPTLPESGVVLFEQDLRTNVPKIVQVSAEGNGVLDEEAKEEIPNKVLLNALPEAPELPPLDANVLKMLQSDEILREYDEDNKSEEDDSDDEEDVKEEDIKEEKSKEEEFKEEPNKEEPQDKLPQEEEIKKEETKEEEPKNDDVKVTIEEVKEKPVADSKKPVLVKIPKPSFFNHIFPFHLPSISSIWPFRGTSILAHARIGYPEYPGYVVDQI